jgi:predicted dehydrogenase
MTRIAVLGCGGWGKNLVRNFHALGVLDAVVDVSLRGREQATRIAPGVRVLEDPQEVLADPSIAGVVIATPAETHAALTLRALEAGKDVLCEKPLALRLDDAVLTAQVAHDRGRILMAGHILEYHPAIVKLRQLIKTGEFGSLRYIYSNRVNLSKVRREENILWSFAPHDVAVILRLVGAMPTQVLAAGGAYIQPHIADVTVTQMQFPTGIAAHVFVSWLNPFKEQRLVVIGSRRMVTFDDVRGELLMHELHVDLADPVPVKGEGIRIEYPADEPLRLECEAYLEAIASRRPPLTDARSALDVMRVLTAAQTSLASNGSPVRLD